jgi:hypothetical protein
MHNIDSIKNNRSPHTSMSPCGVKKEKLEHLDVYSIPTNMCFNAQLQTSTLSLNFVDFSHGTDQALTENKVRAFLVDYYEDCSTLIGKSEECWKAFYGKTHMPDYKLVESSRFPIDNEAMIGLIASGNLKSNILVSVDSVTLLAGGKVAVVNYTTHYKGEKNTVSLTTAVIEEIDGEPKIVQEHRSECQPIVKGTRWSAEDENESTNTIPNDDMPVAPNTVTSTGRWYCESDDLEKESAEGMPIADALDTSSLISPDGSTRRMPRRHYMSQDELSLSSRLDQKIMKRIGSRDKIIRKPRRTSEDAFPDLVREVQSIDRAYQSSLGLSTAHPEEMSNGGNATWGGQNAPMSHKANNHLFQDTMGSLSPTDGHVVWNEVSTNQSPAKAKEHRSILGGSLISRPTKTPSGSMSAAMRTELIKDLLKPGKVSAPRQNN